MMRALIPLLFLGGAAWIAVRHVTGDDARARREGLAANRSADAQVTGNHVAMARLIDHLMSNDFVRGVIPTDEKQKAVRLLKEFYGDDPRHDPVPDYWEE
jgi:hypothetical protein